MFKSFLLTDSPVIDNIQACQDPEESNIQVPVTTLAAGDTSGKASFQTHRITMLMEWLYRFSQITQPEIGRLAGGIDYR